MSQEDPSIQQQLADLRRKLENLESLRNLLGDQAVEDAKAELDTQIRAMVETSGGALVAGDVGIRRGDFVGRDKWQVWVDKLYLDSAPGQVPPEALLQGYYRALATECSRLPLGVVDPRFLQTGSQTPVPLTDIYVDLDVLAPVRDEERNGGHVFLARLAKGEGGERTSLLEAMAHPQAARSVLLGDPGSGKTTFVHYLTYALAAAADDGGPSSFLPAGSPLQGLLPIRLVLREVTAHCIPAGATQGEAYMLWDALRLDIAGRLGEQAAGRLFPHLQRRLLEAGGLILLDGLDEVPEADRRRRCLLESVEDLVGSLPEGRSRVLVTTRPYAYVDPRWHLPDFRILVLAPFDEGQVTRFVGRWYRAVRPVMGWDEATTQARQARLTEGLEGRPYLADLASRPLLLTLMATLHTSWGHLPEDRADLYEETVKLLLSRWQRAREVYGADGEAVVEPGIARVLAVGEDRVRTALHQLAFQAHKAQGQAAERETVPADIGMAQVLASFAPLLPEDFNPQVLLNYLETRTGLLVSRAPGVYAFPHRSFQEYLVACHLADGQDFASELRDRLWQDLDWWRSVFLLGVGKAKKGGLGNAVHVVNTLIPEGPAEVTEPADIYWQAAILAGHALLDLRFPAASQRRPQFEAVLRRVRRWLAALLETPDVLGPRQRAEAGDVMGRLGDPRPGVGTGILWVQVPAGRFQMGSPEDDELAFEGEHPQHTLDLPGFLVSRYPVTNAQYRLFVEGGGYEEPRYWTPDGWAWRTGQREPDLSALEDTPLRRDYADWLAQRSVEKRHQPFWWDQPRWNLDNRPVVGVSWYEAVAYCAWLTEQFEAGDGVLDLWHDASRSAVQSTSHATLRVALPSEAEWEKAARAGHPPVSGGDPGPARRWPWGDEWIEGRANSYEADLGETSAVGIFPAGASPCGALDMAGNVWEWTRSRWGRTSIFRPDYAYPYGPDDGREKPDGPDLRVVRGGSWHSYQRNARCAYRGWNFPDAYLSYLGFRVVASFASSEF